MTYPANILSADEALIKDQVEIEFTDPDNQPAPSGPGGGTAPFVGSADAPVVVVESDDTLDKLDYDQAAGQFNFAQKIHVAGAVTATSGFVAGDNSNFGNHRLTVGSIVSNGNLGFFGTAAVGVQTIDGALSTVLDAAAKDVLTSIIAALVAYGLAVDGTT